MLKTFRQSPALAHRYYVAQDLELARSREMDIGSAVHELLLRGERSSIEMAACATRRAKVYTEAVARHPGALILTQPEAVLAEAVADAILSPRTRAAELARNLLLEGEGYSEYVHTWDDFIGGGYIACKCMVDRLVDVRGQPTIVELKTTRNPAPKAFARQFLDLGYHCQAAFNERGIAHALGGALPNCLVVAVHNETPYEVAVYDVSENFFLLGERQVEEDLEQLAARFKGELPWSASWEQVEDDQFPTLRPPPWATRSLRSDRIIDTF